MSSQQVPGEMPIPPLPPSGYTHRRSVLLWLAGADARLITGPGERARHAAQGVGVIIAGLTSSAGVAALTYYAFGNWAVVCATSVIWALAIMGFDRALVSGPAPAKLWRRIVKYLVLRVALFALPLAIITSQFLELRVFDQQVTREFDLTAQERAEDARDTVVGSDGEPGSASQWVEIQRLRDEQDRLTWELAVAEGATGDAYSAWRDEGFDGAGGRAAGFGPVAAEKERIYREAVTNEDTLRASTTTRLAEIDDRLKVLLGGVETAGTKAYETELAERPTLGTRLEILHDLADDDVAVADMRRNILVLLLAMESFALTLKVGPQSEHDKLVLKRSQTRSGVADRQIQAEAEEAERDADDRATATALESQARRRDVERRHHHNELVQDEHFRGLGLDTARSGALHDLDELEVDFQKVVGAANLRARYYKSLTEAIDEADEARKGLLGHERETIDPDDQDGPTDRGGA